MIVEGSQAIEDLSLKVGKRWTAVDAARAAAVLKSDEIATILSTHRLIPSDTSFVVFGSLARGEWTAGSDIDWTLLIDGEADPNHLKVAQSIASHLAGVGPGPGRTATFGNLAFSHDIVHQIGGDSDTNRNTTQRI